MTAPVVICAEHLSKKFAQSLRSAMVYGLHDIAQAAWLPRRRGRTGMPKPGGRVAEDLRPSEFWALKDVSFEIVKGERVGIIGPNGAGKSTLFSLLSGIYGPTEGRIEIHGRLQALIALGAGFHPLLSGRENIYINGAILGMDTRTIDRKLDEIIAFADIGEFIDAPVKNYSSGMLVRLGFAVAAHMDPDILLIDEILAVGDATFQTKCLEFSRRMSEAGRTIVTVTHNMSQVQRACERAIWLDHGRIMMDGPAEEVVRGYSLWVLKGLLKSADFEVSESLVAGDTVSFRYEIETGERSQQDGARAGEHADLPKLTRGSSLRLKIHYAVHCPIHGQLSFWAIVKDALSGVRVFGTAGWVQNVLFGAKPGQQDCVVIEWPEVPLSDGFYNLDLGVSVYSPGAGETGNLAKIYEKEPSFRVVSPPGELSSVPEGLGTADHPPLVSLPVRMYRENSTVV